MHASLWRRAFAALAPALVIAACSDQPTTAPDTSPGELEASRGAQGAPAATQQPKAGLEINYMEFTIDHHAMGVGMAQLCIQKAVHAELRELCQTELATQSAQIQQLQSWLQAWYGIAYQPEMTQGDQRMMDMLAALSGAEFEVEFMETFSRHHHQIIQRSQPIADQAVHPELRQLATSIIQAQTAGIQDMLTWLCEWYNICHTRFGISPG